jgi:3alpha(or 20beta)-hydroxysteroid dehydrogenase
MPERPLRCPDKVVLVTGAAGGQGLAAAAALAAEGATVVAADVKDPVNPLPDGVTFRHLDVAEPEDWEATAEWLLGTHGRVDGLVNNAARPSRARLDNVTLEEWNATFAVNAAGPMLGITTLEPLIPDGGSIVNVGSLAATTAHNVVAYTASKWALRGLSRVASMELGRRGIRVNSVFPGFVDSPMTARTPPEFREVALLDIPLGRLGTVDDMAPLIVLLISDESSWITGAEIAVDGGQWAHGGQKPTADATYMLIERARETADARAASQPGTRPAGGHA